ncbi:MAG: hypothetical protein JRI55_24170, partial [Deltaproteobacteria bacterium]|nr:hypothetical protein [Deltaproteobacteria bacterium]
MFRTIQLMSFNATLVLGGLVVAACGDDDDDADAAAGDTDTDTDTDADGDTDTDADGDSDDDSISIFGSCKHKQDEPLEGVEVCWHPVTGDPSCDTTNENGAFAVEGVAPNTGGYLAIRLEGFQDMDFWFAVREDNLNLGMSLATDAEFASMVESAGVTQDAGNGSIAVQAVGPGSSFTAGAELAIAPTAGEGPFYLSAESDLEVDAAATATTGGAGGALFLDVPPGDYAVVMTSMGSECEPHPAVPNITGQLEVRAGVQAAVIVSCRGCAERDNAGHTYHFCGGSPGFTWQE